MFNVPSFFGFKSGTAEPFEFTINTANTSTGSSSSDQFKLPLSTSTGLNCTVYWGDGSYNNITSHTAPEVTHTYPSSGTYTIKITGSLLGWAFDNDGDRLKMLDIKKWSGLTISINLGFYGCTNLTASATDAPLITFTSLSNYFRGCSNFNGQITNWDISSVTNMARMFDAANSFNQPLNLNTSSVTIMDQMFRGANAFDQDISSWDINQVTSFSSFMVAATGLSTTNYDLLLVGWEANLQALYPSGVGYPYTINIDFGGSQYTLLSTAATARASLISVFGWTITDGGGI
jgi:surface protein